MGKNVFFYFLLPYLLTFHAGIARLAYRSFRYYIEMDYSSLLQDCENALRNGNVVLANTRLAEIKDRFPLAASSKHLADITAIIGDLISQSRGKMQERGTESGEKKKKSKKKKKK